MSFYEYPDAEPERVCRVCGCTEEDACVLPLGGCCTWVEADLCSACVPEEPIPFGDDESDMRQRASGLWVPRSYEEG